MNGYIDRAFGLGEGMRFGDPGVSFGLAHELPAWAWVLAAAVAFAAAGWSYWRLEGGKATRAALACVRGLLLLLLVFLAAGPQLVRPNERTERDWVVVLLDRSASMSIADTGPPGGTGAARVTRDEQLREALRRSAPAWASIAKDRNVLWLGFDGGAYDAAAGEKGRGESEEAAGVDVEAVLRTLPAASGRRTSLGAALDQALQRVAARPVSGVVVLSDGRSVDEPGRQALRRLTSDRIPVITVPLGSADPVGDLAVERPEAPALAFINDTVPVSVRIDRIGAGAGRTGGRVQLIEKSTGLVLDERPIPEDDASWTQGGTNLTLTTKPALPGKSEWVVRLIPGGADLIEENNAAEVAVEMVDRPLRVVYFDGYPRWEYRYLKNLLVRETSIRSASVLLASNRQYIQEGDTRLDAIPRSPEEWARFDVVIMGDLPPGLFGEEALEQLREHVATRGAGLLWVGGPAWTPQAWFDSPLADLLPFSGGGGAQPPVRAWDEPVTMTRAPAAVNLGLLRLSDGDGLEWPERLSDPATGWSMLRFAQRIDPAALKPTAEVLAYAVPASAGGGSVAASLSEAATPLVLSMRYGAGRVLYVGTDEIWRWRFARGEALPERFWLPLIRLQGRESLARNARPAVIEASPRRAEVQQPVRVSIELLDQALVDSAPQTLTVRIARAESSRGEAEQDQPVELALSPEQTSSGSARPALRSFAGTWLPDESGVFRISAADPVLASLGLSTEVDVAFSDDELRKPETDHPLLARLSEQTEGRVIPPAQLSEIGAADVLPKRARQIAGAPDTHTLWDRPPALFVLMLLLTVEWVGRKVLRLA